jgi:hypothetical protein
MTRPLSRWIVGLSVAGAILAGVVAFRAVFPGLQAKTDRIQLEVSAIRGLPFGHRVEAGRESNAEFRASVDRRLRKHPMPPHYGIVVRAVGLYRGPVITDPEGLLKETMTTAGGGYYDVDRRKFFLLREIAEPRLSSALAHELYHALQDQHFGIERYLAPPDPLNRDKQVARKAVLEGEAAYVQFMYTLKTADGRMPTHKLLGEFIRAQPENRRPHSQTVLRISIAACFSEHRREPPRSWWRSSLGGVTAFWGLAKIGALRGKRDLITGAAGGVGSAAVSIARAQGASVIAAITLPYLLYEQLTGLGAAPGSGQARSGIFHSETTLAYPSLPFRSVACLFRCPDRCDGAVLGRELTRDLV